MSSEQAINPYAAPGATVADVYEDSAGVQPVKLWSAKGRIGRVRFLAYMFYSYALFMLAAMVLGGVIGFTGFKGGEAAISIITLVLAIPYLVFYVLTGIQRSHDMDWSGWTLLLALIPLVALIWIFKPGTQGSNRFGAPPPPNTLSVIIGAWLLPAIAIVGIIAAIALPAMQR
ncbi:uncharacterized membrane protein YhaH (DUF805 family) [Variovorax sp. TBS-050B]|uniref:DUF805 domain-containing protein n=1 Tax=Variovorax sp. TBS-050B TaxID=2940551 RepID=UPI0024763868|nr:DUF805 domain-containing protein [Variovorax sp. TBS-050B]MDH6591573.1 uncharacterized membrane protein YhaH (DUF805 family) [Variovorax sp. TBS-050B]